MWCNSRTPHVWRSQPASEDADDELRYKYPYLAFEIFFCEVTQITNAVVDNKATLDSFMGFLSQARARAQRLTTVAYAHKRICARFAPRQRMAHDAARDVARPAC